LTTEEALAYLREMHQKRGYTLEMHRIMAAADLEWAKTYGDFIEATYVGQRLLDRKTKELLQIVVEAALRADVEQIQAHVRLALREGATPREILEALEAVIAPMGALAFRRGLQAWAAEKKVLRIWHTETEPQSVQAFQGIINEFEKLRPDITVKQEALAWGDLEAKLTAALAAGAPPDASHGQAVTCASFYAKGLLRPMEDVAEAIARMLADPGTAGRTYELGGPGVYTLRELVSFVLRIIDKRRLLLPVPFTVAEIQARLFELLPNPPLTTGQVDLLRVDNLAGGALPGFRELDIRPKSIEEIVPAYLAAASSFSVKV